MKCKQIWCCEFCTFTAEDRMTVLRHEAEHFHLTQDQYNTWNQLTRQAAKASRETGIASTPETRQAFNKAVETLCIFEQKHNLTNQRRPSHMYY